MASTPESKVKKKVRLILDAIGAYYVFPQTGGFGNSGMPDILCCINGRFVGIECKANGGKVTRLQQSHLDEIEMRGGVALIVNENNLESLEQLLLERTK